MNYVSVPPSINLDDFKNVKVKAGQPIDLKVGINGCPAPTVEWFLDDKPLKAGGSGDDDEEIDDDIETPTTNKEAQLGIKKADKKHRGKLKLRVTNEHGTTEAEVDITVFGKTVALLKTQQRSHRKNIYINWRDSNPVFLLRKQML